MIDDAAVGGGRYRLERAFPPSDDQRRRAIEMWMREGVFPDAPTRTSEALVVIR